MDDHTQWQTMSIGAGLIAINIILIRLLMFTAVPELVKTLFNTFIVGVIVFTLFITTGTYLARKGVREYKPAFAIPGVAMLQIGYGAFGSGALSVAPGGQQITVLAITTIITMTIAIVEAAIVYNTKKDFHHWRHYYRQFFIAAFITAVIATFIPILNTLAFILALAGYIIYLMFEIWATRAYPPNVWLNGIGIYSAFTGVFVHILQIVVRFYGRKT